MKPTFVVKYYVHDYELSRAKLFLEYADSLEKAQEIERNILRCRELYNKAIQPGYLLSEVEDEEYDKLMGDLGFGMAECYILDRPIRISRREKIS